MFGGTRVTCFRTLLLQDWNPPSYTGVICGPGCERSEEERDEFWNDLTRCVDGPSTRNYVVVLGDMNARVGDGEVEGVVGKYGVPGENESGERLLDMCVEQELVIGNSFF